jgi:hypothetical protein
MQGKVLIERVLTGLMGSSNRVAVAEGPPSGELGRVGVILSGALPVVINEIGKIDCKRLAMLNGLLLVQQRWGTLAFEEDEDHHLGCRINRT